jgi:hypothetical protein
VSYANSVPTTSAIDVTFDSVQFNHGPHQAADGIALFFAAADPGTSSAPAISMGATGGALGYSPGGGNGLTNAYLGVGLDVYGNFETTGTNGTGCGSNPVPGFTPESVTVRGPGNNGAGYCVLNSTSGVGSLNDESGDDSFADMTVPVEVAINPTDNDVLTASNHTVPAHKYFVAWTPVFGSEQTMSGSLPNASAYLSSGWTDTNGVPTKVTFGWTGATGAAADIHLISNTNAVALSAPKPALGLQLSDDSSVSVHNGDTVTYTASASVTNADETQPIRVIDTFPAGLTPQAASGTGWGCSASSGQTVDCTYMGGTISSGNAAPDLSIPVNVSFPSGTSTHNVTNQATVSSSDADPASAQSNADSFLWLAATVLQFINQPITTGVNAAMDNTDNTVRHVTVAGYVTPGGTLDTGYTGTVTLSFANNPGNGKFVVGGSPTSTMTAQAVNGVADFSPVIINAAGFGYTVNATDTPDRLTQATSASFDVAGAATGCPAGQQCQTSTSNQSNGDNAGIVGKAGSNGTIVAVTFGGNVAPLIGCSTTPSTGILTFSGNRQKIITLTIPATVVGKKVITKFCYGQPTPWYGLGNGKLVLVKSFNSANQDYEGQLATCGTIPKQLQGGPCIQSITWKRGQPEIAVIQSSTTDPHLVR